MKKGIMKTITLTMSAALLSSSFGVTASAAALKADNLTDLAKVIREQAMNRNANFTVTFNGSDNDWNYLFGSDLRFFYYDMIKLDDASTSNDADYIVGNIDFSKDYVFSDEDSNDLTFTFHYFETSEQTAYVNQHTPEILNDLGVANMSNYDKVKTIHDFVCSLITYKADAENCSSVYSAYYTGFGLCNSYALCMYKLLTEAGVPCKWIGGSAGTGRDAAGHAWNIVELGNQWYNLDATWDDGDEISYNYFLKGSDDFDAADPSQVHTMDTEYFTSNFLKDFPIAKTAFQPGSNDENTNTNPMPAPTVTKYDFAKIINGKYPKNGKLTIKRKKTGDIQLFIKNAAAKDTIKKVSYKVTSGAKYIKVKNYGICTDNKDYFTDLRITGKKKGTAKIKTTVTLKNNQTKSYTFTVKVK